MQIKPWFRMLSLYLVIATVLLTLPSQGWAMFLAPDGAVTVKQADMTAIQKTLESSMIKQRLQDYGLSTEETMARINSLSDEQVHQVAAQLDSVQAGGDLGGTVIFILILMIILVVLIQVSGHRVVVTK